jgi:methyl-accepting chemotaxis protein
VVRELISWPISMARAAIELPRSMERSIREANDLMEVSREQLEVMRRQADQALEQAERMNELLGRVVRLTEPLERAQRGGEYVAGELKKAIFGAEQAAIEAEVAVEEAKEATEKAEEAADTRGGPAGVAEEPPDSPLER